MAMPKSYGESRKASKGIKNAGSLTDTKLHDCDRGWSEGTGNVRSSRLPGDGMHSTSSSKPKGSRGRAY